MDSNLEAVKDRLTRKFRGDWMDSIYPGLSFHQQIEAFGRDLISLGEAVLKNGHLVNKKDQ